MTHDERKIDSLIADLDDHNKPTVRSAADQLIALALGSRNISTALDRRLQQPGHRQYWPVAYVLGHLPEPSQATNQNLLDALDHRDADIRWAVALLLVQIAQRQSWVSQGLIALCRAGTTNQKRMGIYCLRNLSLNDAASLEALCDALRDGDATVRVAAVISLKYRADGNDLVREALLRNYLHDPEIKVRNAAAVTLANFGSPSEEFMLALQRASQSEHSQTRRAAHAALQILENNKARSNR